MQEQGSGSLYAERGGVDYRLLQTFKDKMIAVSQRTRELPLKRGVRLLDLPHSHGAVFQIGDLILVSTLEGLGNKDWLAQLMFELDPSGGSRIKGCAIDTALMAVNDAAAHGAMPVVLADEITARKSEWFANSLRAQDFADGIEEVCKDLGMALGAGESPAYKYLVQSQPPVKEDAPIMSANVISIVQPARNLVTGAHLQPGDRIIGAFSNGNHANGISLIISCGLELPDGFLTKLPSGNFLGDVVLTPTRSYVQLVEALLDEQIEVHAFLPGTGDGVAKLAFDKRPMTYYVHSWLADSQMPEIFRYLRDDLHLPLLDLLTTFNWGIGWCIFVPEREVEAVLQTAEDTGYTAMEVGYVKEGDRQTIFGPAGDLVLPPPGE